MANKINDDKPGIKAFHRKKDGIMNIKMIIAYDGSRYFGWEHQPDRPMTIQGKLEAVLSEMTGQNVEVTGAGRTDAGVHAEAMCANFRIDSDKSPDEIKEYMNRYLPDDICVKELRPASERFHSRYNATGKVYRYSIWMGDEKPVFERKYVLVPERVPDLEKMKEAASHLTGRHDFASFCGHARMKKSTVREIYSIDFRRQGDRLDIYYRGNGFLQYMVRILTGTLLEVGMGEREAGSIPSLLQARDRRLAGFTAPAKGLRLMSVEYS